MSKFEKRGLSPVVATMLLVSVTLILAVIIFFWARNFIGENIQKQGRAVELLCDDVNFKAEAYREVTGGDMKLFIENLGSVPINGVEIKEEVAVGEIKKVETIPGGGTLTAGQTSSFDLSAQIGSGDKIIITPILLGETSTEKKSHICGEEYGVEITVE